MSDEWSTYRTKFLVRAKQLSEPMTFTDVLGREHHGNRGDYVVQSSHGPRIAPRAVFEDVYVRFCDEPDGLSPESEAADEAASLAI